VWRTRNGEGLLYRAHAQGIRVSCHGAAATTDDDRHQRALRRECGHHMVTGLVVGSMGLGDWGCTVKSILGR
jgi:hypothetical protein